MVKPEPFHVAWTSDRGIHVFGTVPRGTKPEDVDLSNECEAARTNHEKLNVTSVLDLADVVAKDICEPHILAGYEAFMASRKK